MRTTITIDDQLLDDLKQRAASEGTTVSRLIEDSVRLARRRRPSRKKLPAFKLVTFGRGGRFTSLDIDKVSSILETDDITRHGRRR